jgi:aminoglycoside/choline kinase family phosphotransferase
MAKVEAPPRPAVTEYVGRYRPGATLVPLAGDASTRRFYRLVDPSGSTSILMDYGKTFSAETDDIHLSRIFDAAGLRIAGILKVAPEPGCLVLEDLGDMLLEGALAEQRPGERSTLLMRAAALAANVRKLGTPILAASDRAEGPRLDEERFHFEMEFFLEHFACGLRGIAPVDASLQLALGNLARSAAESSDPVLCHRDFHSRNLLVLPGGDLAMVDVQDACWGPDSYDLASLLRDAYIDVDEASIEPLIRHYLGRLDDGTQYAEYRKRFDVVAAQRMIKALGTFGYQIAVRGRTRYSSGIPRTVDRLRRLLPTLEATRTLGERMLRSGLLDG